MSGYPQYLKYYIWSWQVHFRISCQTGAETLFNSLDRGLSPDVFLIGFLKDELENRLPICIEPEELKFDISEFEKVDAIADTIYKNDPENRLFYTGVGMQEEMNGRRKGKSIKLALEKVLNESENNEDNIYFVSSSTYIDGYKVYIVLGLNRSIYESHIHLRKIDPEERMKLYYSLIESVKDLYLEDRVLNLKLPNAGKNLSEYTKESDEILRLAAKKFMHTIGWVGSDVEGVLGLFNACNKISITKYEKSESEGTLIIAKENHPSIEMTLEINPPFEIKDNLKTRKMLQLSNNEVGIICNSKKILGLGKIKATYDKTSESIFHIEFKGTNRWEVFHSNQKLFQMNYGLPMFPQEAIDKVKFKKILKRLFKKISKVQVNNLLELSIIASTQKKGALLVFSEDANDEAKRLEKHCINIKPKKLNKDLILSLTGIDGALIADLDGVAYAKGVILDGIVGLDGNPARGSRYNSAIRYQEYRGLEKPTLIVVVSEDGMVDIIPDLLPQIRQIDILKMIEVLENLNSEDSFERTAFYNTITWLANRSFYLSENDCIKINGLKDDLQNLDKKLSKSTMWQIFDNISPNPRMNDSYFV